MIFLCLIQEITFDLRIWPIMIFLFIQGLWNVIAIYRNKNVSIKMGFKVIITRLLTIIVTFLCMLPFLIFPFYHLITPSGPMKFKTTTVTWKNTAKTQPFIKTKDGTKYVTVQFWYPVSKKGENPNKKYPLVMFCHGFGMFRNSNLTMMQELASQGYIVGSIDLDYETFWSIHEDKSIHFWDLREKTELNHAKTDYETSKISKKWDHMRENDINNAIDYIIELSNKQNSKAIFHKIDIDKIAMTGHSYGGSVSASIGRSNPNVKAAIDMDGTAWGEIKKIDKDKIIDITSPYPIPILMMYSQTHDEMIKEFEKTYGNMYPNEVILAHAKEGYRAMVKGSDHFSFSDMHLNTPLSAYFSGATQTRDSRETIKVINHIMVEFLNKYLKGEDVNLKKNAVY